MLDVRRSTALAIMTAVIAAFMGAGFAWVLYEQVGPAQRVIEVATTTQPSHSGAAPLTVADLAESASHSCVEVITGPVSESGVEDGSAPVATGFVVGSPGVVVTTSFALKGATSLELATPDGHLYPALVVGSDVGEGLVVLKAVGNMQVPPLSLASSAPVPGDVEVAVGLPPIGSLTVVSGTVSAVGSGAGVVLPSGVVDTVTSAAILNAATGPGLVGGPVVNAEGQVVGVAAGAGTQGGVVSLDYSTIQALVSAAEGGAAAVGATFGAESVFITPATAAALGTRSGALITSVSPGGAAAAAGLQAGDVVVSVGGVPITANRLFDPQAFQIPASETVQLSVLRGKEQFNVSITAGESG